MVDAVSPRKRVVAAVVVSVVVARIIARIAAIARRVGDVGRRIRRINWIGAGLIGVGIGVGDIRGGRIRRARAVRGELAGRLALKTALPKDAIRVALA